MSATKTLSLPIDADLAEVWQSTPEKDQLKLQYLLNLWLRDLFTQSKSLKSLMDDISEKAQSRGLTEEKLEELLRDC